VKQQSLVHKSHGLKQRTIMEKTKWVLILNQITVDIDAIDPQVPIGLSNTCPCFTLDGGPPVTVASW
jgi:hypothetical protein